MSIGIATHRRCRYNNGTVSHSRPIKTLYHQRSLSSARPMPDDEHEEVVWTYNEATQIGRAKRAPSYSNMQQCQLSVSPSTLPTSSTMYDDPTTAINWTEEEDTSNAIATNPNETKSKALSATLPERAEYESPSTLRYTGDAVIPITSILHIVKPKEDAPRGIWPVFRLFVCRPSFASLKFVFECNSYNSLLMCRKGWKWRLPQSNVRWVWKSWIWIRAR